jgi:hypothetical protein
MLTLRDMREIARSRVAEAAILIRADRYDTAVYLCGYAVEISLKARICRTLGWAEFPNEPKEWQRYHAHLKVHDLKLLAKWSGHEIPLNDPAHISLWLEVREWNPETRYQPAGRNTRAQALSILRATRILAELLNPR